MSLLGLDLNATRARAVRGPLGDYPWTMPLHAPHVELPLVLSLATRGPVVGAAGLRVCRKSPRLAWQNFLPQLAQAPPPGREWATPQTKLDAAKALGLVLQHAARSCGESAGVVLALPVYLSALQVEKILTVAHQAGLPVLGSIAGPLAAALAAYAEQAWFGTAVIVDVDSHALTVAAVASCDGRAQLLDVRYVTGLGQHAWRERLLNALADCCILESRWDPRESAAAEQSLFDQLDDVLDAAQQGRPIKLTVEGPGRFQHLVLQPGDPTAFCTNLRRLAVAEVEHIVTTPWPEGAPSVVLATAAAARLPGLTAGLQSCLQQLPPADVRKKKTTLSAIEDFGSGLLEENRGEPCSVVELSVCAVARGAHSVAGYFQRGDIPRGHLHAMAPLPLPQPLEAGPARLHFQGRDILLGTSLFIIGRQAEADLLFDGEEWPNVSGRHCEIAYNHRTHMLSDHSRAGTWVNDQPVNKAIALRPGDWIRLGPDGPLLRFLGQPSQVRTTA
jgi:FHA domain